MPEGRDRDQVARASPSESRRRRLAAVVGDEGDERPACPIGRGRSGGWILHAVRLPARSSGRAPRPRVPGRSPATHRAPIGASPPRPPGRPTPPATGRRPRRGAPGGPLLGGGILAGRPLAGPVRARRAGRARARPARPASSRGRQVDHQARAPPAPPGPLAARGGRAAGSIRLARARRSPSVCVPRSISSASTASSTLLTFSQS